MIVRHGDDASSDGGGRRRFTLVRPDGTTIPISVETEENAHGVDPDQPYLSRAEPVPGGVEGVVHDVDADTEVARVEVARVEVEGSFDRSPPPVALDGDTVDVGGRDGEDLLALAWRTGDVTDADTDGLRLSPDGSYAVASTFDVRTGAQSSEVVEVEGDASEPERAEDNGFDQVLGGLLGFSSTGQPFTVDGDMLTVCDPATGGCDSRRDPVVADAVDRDGNVLVQLGGVLYES